MNNETNIITFEQKKDFILKYLFDNFSISKEQFLNNYTISDENFQGEIFRNSIFDSDYSLVFVKIEYNSLFLKQFILRKFIDPSTNFFVIKGFNEEERSILKQHHYKNNLNLVNDIYKSITYKNELIELLLSVTPNSFDYRDLTVGQFNKDYIVKLYELISTKENIKEELLNF